MVEEWDKKPSNNVPLHQWRHKCPWKKGHKQLKPFKRWTLIPCHANKAIQLLNSSHSSYQHLIIGFSLLLLRGSANNSISAFYSHGCCRFNSHCSISCLHGMRFIQTRDIRPFMLLNELIRCLLVEDLCSSKLSFSMCIHLV